MKKQVVNLNNKSVNEVDLPDFIFMDFNIQALILILALNSPIKFDFIKFH